MADAEHQCGWMPGGVESGRFVPDANGQPQTNDQSNTNVANRGAILRPDAVSTHYYAGQSRAQYFNLAAFSATPVGAGRFGNAGVGILQGPGTAAVSLGRGEDVSRLRRRCMRGLSRRLPMC